MLGIWRKILGIKRGRILGIERQMLGIKRGRMLGMAGMLAHPSLLGEINSPGNPFFFLFLFVQAFRSFSSMRPRLIPSMQIIPSMKTGCVSSINSFFSSMSQALGRSPASHRPSQPCTSFHHSC